MTVPYFLVKRFFINEIFLDKPETHLEGVFVFPDPRPFAWPPTLVLVPGPGPQFVFSSSGANLHLLALAPKLHLPVLAPNLYLPALAHDLCLPALVCNITNKPGPAFCIYQPCLLNLCLYLRPWPTISITSMWPELAFILLLVVVAVLVVIVVVVISLE